MKKYFIFNGIFHYMTPELRRTRTILGYFNYLQVDDVTDRRIVEFSILVSLLFFMDILTTQIILRMGGMELNPVMGVIVSNPWIHIALKSAILFLIIGVSLIAEKKVRGSSMVLYCSIVSLYLFVVVNNVFVILPGLMRFVIR